MRAEPCFLPARQRGVSIIELMIGLVVSLIVGLAATSSALMFSAAQRQGIGVGGVAVNINTALMALKNDAATAGLGFFGESRYLCDKLNFSVGATVYADGTAFAPLRITRTAGQDRIDVLQATRVESGASVLLAAPTTGAEAQLKSFLPADDVKQDAVLIAPESTGDPCLVRTVTKNEPAVDETPQRLLFAAAGTHNAAGFSTNPTYGGSANSAGGAVTLLGELRWQRYRLSGTDLVLEQPLTGASAVLARNVMAMRAQYGTSAPGSKTLAGWSDATGGFAALDNSNIAQVRALRVGVVTRSPQRDKACDGRNTVRDPLEPGVAPDITVDVSNPECYRFRSAVLVIPLRNLVQGIP